MERRDLQTLSRIRFREAKALLRLGFDDGAYYLGGYAAECGLKACIARATKRHEFPDKKRVEASHTHDLKVLVKIANLESSRLDRVKSDEVFRKNWELVEEWSEHSRYARNRKEDARALLAALADRHHGVIPG